jgi:thioredoxin-related protein
LTREVFETKSFKKWAKENVVLYHADFPRSKSVPKKQKAANEALKSKFSVKGFPTVVFMTADEKELGRTGYLRETGPEAWIKNAEPIVAKAADHLWMTDYEAARKLAKKQRRPMLVSFDGSDW